MTISQWLWFYEIDRRENCQTTPPLLWVNGHGFNGKIYSSHRNTGLTKHTVAPDGLKLTGATARGLLSSYGGTGRCVCMCIFNRWLLAMCACMCTHACFSDIFYAFFRGWLASVSVSSCYQDNECVPPHCYNKQCLIKAIAHSWSWFWCHLLSGWVRTHWAKVPN